jgi:hypothetical protein
MAGKSIKNLSEARFWKLLKKSKSVSARSPQLQYDRLVKLLSKKSVREIVMFERLFKHLIAMADLPELRGAAQVVKAEVDEKYFLNFRAWLVLRGKKSYYQVLKNPDFLAKVLKYTDDPEWPGYLHCAEDAYKRKTGKPLSEYQKVASRPWKESELPDRFPRLWKKFTEIEGGK